MTLSGPYYMVGSEVLGKVRPCRVRLWPNASTWGIRSSTALDVGNQRADPRKAGGGVGHPCVESATQRWLIKTFSFITPPISPFLATG